MKATSSLKSGIGFSIAPSCQLITCFHAVPRWQVLVPREDKQEQGKWERQAWPFLDSSHPQMHLRVCRGEVSGLISPSLW